MRRRERRVGGGEGRWEEGCGGKGKGERKVGSGTKKGSFGYTDVTTCPQTFFAPLPTDGSSVGIVLGSASEEELRQLDHLLSLMTDFRVAEDGTGKQTSRGRVDQEEG